MAVATKQVAFQLRMNLTLLSVQKTTYGFSFVVFFFPSWLTSVNNDTQLN